MPTNKPARPSPNELRARLGEIAIMAAMTQKGEVLSHLRAIEIPQDEPEVRSAIVDTLSHILHFAVSRGFSLEAMLQSAEGHTTDELADPNE